MANQLQVTKKLVDGKFVVEAELLPGGDLPTAIFVYENLGGTALGEYIGIVDPDELTRFKLWEGNAIPVFGNKFLRHTKMKRAYPSDAVADGSIQYLLDQIRRLEAELDSEGPDVEVFNV